LLATAQICLGDVISIDFHENKLLFLKEAEGALAAVEQPIGTPPPEAVCSAEGHSIPALGMMAAAQRLPFRSPR